MQKGQIQLQITLKLQVEENICYTLKEAEAIQKQCDKKMSEAAPIFKNAVEGLLQITRKEINELRAIVRPLDTIKMLMTAVCLILDEPPQNVCNKETGFVPQPSYWAAAIS